MQYGLGDAVDAHGPHEPVLLDELAVTARTLVLLAVELCGAG